MVAPVASGKRVFKTVCDSVVFDGQGEIELFVRLNALNTKY